MRLYLRAYMLAYYVVYLLIGIQLVCPHVNKHGAGVGNHVVLCSSVYHRYSHLCWSEQVAHLLKLVVSQPYHVVKSLVYGVYSLVACCMSAFSVADYVEHHQSTLRYGRLHSCWLSHYGNVNVWQQWKDEAYAVGSAHLLFC